MGTKNSLFVSFCICLVAIGCNPGSKEAKLKFEPVSDTLYKPDENYKQALFIWKQYYGQCMNEQLFPDAFYLQLQNKMPIGSINNERELGVNKGVNILDTSRKKDIFNLMAIINSARCTDTLNLIASLKNDFYVEVVKALNASPEHKSLLPALDTGSMKVKISSVYNNMLRTDSLINLLNTTQDSSLIHFKALLLKPGNVLLAQTIDVFGFEAEFRLQSKLPGQQKKQLEKEVFFYLDNSAENVSIHLASNNHVTIKIGKRYTVFGRFLKFNAG